MSDLPDGFVLEQPAAPQTSSGLPPGFELEGQSSSQEPRSFMDKLGETSWGKLAKSAYGAVTLPGDVLAGKVAPESNEAIGRAFDAATFFTPLPAAMRAGEGIFGVPIRPRPDAVVSPGIQAAQSAADLGAPLPRGLATDSTAMQAATKAAQQLPLVGPKIGERAAATVNAAGQKVGDIASELSGGVVDRASTGAMLRPSIKGVIENNNSRIDEAFNSLRGMIDHTEPVELPNTEKVLKQVVSAREAAGQVNPKAGLEDISNLVDKGATFNGLLRAKSDLSSSVKFGEANPGFSVGDKKMLGGAMARDLEHVVAQSAKEGVAPEAAVSALRNANATAAPIFDFNKTLERLSGIKSDESLVGSLTKAAQDKTGNVKLLAQLRNSMPTEDFEQIAGTALSELGHSNATGKFSLNQFVTKWDKLGDRAKSVLFSPQHKADLDSIVSIGRKLKDSDKYANTSNTAGAAAWGKLLAGGAAAIGALTYGDATLLVKGLAAGGTGLLFARELAKPAGASTIAKWTRAAVLADHGHTPARLATFRMATRNLLNNLGQTQTNLPQSSTPQQQ